MKKFNIKYNLHNPLKFTVNSTFYKNCEKGVKNEVTLTDNFNCLAGVYHQYVFKYEILSKYLQLCKSLFNKIKQEVEKSELLPADILNLPSLTAR